MFVQAGVGSLAGAIQGYFANLYPDNCPTTVVMAHKTDLWIPSLIRRI